MIHNEDLGFGVVQAARWEMRGGRFTQNGETVTQCRDMICRINLILLMMMVVAVVMMMIPDSDSDSDHSHVHVHSDDIDSEDHGS